jgi:hypothetical protein
MRSIENGNSFSFLFLADALAGVCLLQLKQVEYIVKSAEHLLTQKCIRPIPRPRASRTQRVLTRSIPNSMDVNIATDLEDSIQSLSNSVRSPIFYSPERPSQQNFAVIDQSDTHDEVFGVAAVSPCFGAPATTRSAKPQKRRRISNPIGRSSSNLQKTLTPQDLLSITLISSPRVVCRQARTRWFQGDILPFPSIDIIRFLRIEHISDIDDNLREASYEDAFEGIHRRFSTGSAFSDSTILDTNETLGDIFAALTKRKQTVNISVILRPGSSRQEIARLFIGVLEAASAGKVKILSKKGFRETFLNF